MRVWRVLAVIAGLALSTIWAPASADYLVVGRPATIKAAPGSNAAVLEKLASGAELVLLDGGQKKDGYYRVGGVTQPQAGWIYGNLVRRRPGAISTPPAAGRSANAAGSFGLCADIFVGARAPVVANKQITPLCEQDDEVAFFATGYSKADNRGIWSAYWLDKDRVEEIENSGSRPRLRFRKNQKLEDGNYLQPTHDDYTNNEGGYNRGHFAPSHALAWDETAQRATFQVTNIAPQDGKMNQNIWRCFEVTIIDWANKYGELHVVVGGDGAKKTIGKKVQISVPTHYFAMVYRKEPQPMAVAVRIPNEGGHLDIRPWMKSVSELQQEIGVTFGLPDSVVAAVLNKTDWPVRNPVREQYIPNADEHCRTPTN